MTWRAGIRRGRIALALLVCPGVGTQAQSIVATERGSPPERRITRARHASVTRVEREHPAPAVSGAPGTSSARPTLQRQAARGTLDTATFWSQSLGTRKRYVVWLPPSYSNQRDQRYPVAYYLHGAFGTETDWTKFGHLDRKLDSLVAGGMPEIIAVMPDGDDGFYTTWNRLPDAAACRLSFERTAQFRDGESADTYCVPWPHYDDYIARDLVAEIDRRYRSLADRQHRGIAGLSMGGYGAFALALQYPDVFSAAASHSGVVSPLYAGPKPFAAPPLYAASETALRDAWGSFWPLVAPAFGSDTAGWWARDPARLAQRLLTARAWPVPALFLDVGTEDDLVDQSRALRWELQRLGVGVEYAEWPGKHDWDYWRRHARESLTWLVRHLSVR